MMKQFLVVALMVTGINASLYATIKPQPFPGDSRITRAAYQDNNVVPIKGQTFTNTQVVFSTQEHILDVEGGDRDGWIVTLHKNLPNMLFVKPTIMNSDSNITVVTTRHTYYFHVTSNKYLFSHEPRTYALKFYYPEDERLQLKATLDAQKRHRAATANAKKPQKNYNWNYSFNGAPDLMPVHVFDDGVFTYFEMHPNQAQPAVFLVDNQHGEEEVVNLRRQGAFLVVQRTAPQFTLRMGVNQIASVFNNKEITRLQGRRTA